MKNIILDDFIITDTHNIIWVAATVWFDGEQFHVGHIFTTESNVSMHEKNVRPTNAETLPLSYFINENISASNWDFDVNEKVYERHFIIPKTKIMCAGFALTDTEVKFVCGNEKGGFTIVTETIDKCIELFEQCENQMIYSYLVAHQYKVS